MTLVAVLDAQPRGPSPLALRPLWTLRLGAALSAPPAFAGTRAYVPLGGDRIDAFDLEKGAQLWSVKAGVLTRPAVGDGLVFLDTTGALLALRESDGGEAWRLAITDPLATAVVWDIGWLITQTRSGVVTAYRAVDGHPIWQHEAGSAPSAPPALAADRVYLSLADGRVVALLVESGTPLWERRLPGPPGEILALDTRLYVGAAGTTDRALFALNARSGQIEWRWRTGGAVVGRPVLDDRNVYFAALDNVLRALDRNHGAQRWYSALPLRPSGPATIAGDVVLVPGVTPALPTFFRSTGDASVTGKLPGNLAAGPHVIENDWAPIVVAITRDIAQGDQLRAMGRPIDPEIVPVAPLPNVVRPAAPGQRQSPTEKPTDRSTDTP